METNQEIFIQSIKINEVRHLHDVEVALHQDKRTHLILTGKNGSGKTSVLEAVRESIGKFSKEYFELLQGLYKSIESLSTTVKSWKTSIVSNSLTEEHRKQIEENIKNYESAILQNENQVKDFYKQINLSIANISELSNEYKKALFLLSYIDSKRTISNQNTKKIFKIPKGIEKITFKQQYDIQESAGFDFLQHIVNLKADRSFAKDDNDTTVVEALDIWFERFENSLKLIFGDDSLSLDFDRKTYNFYVTQQNRPKVTFNELSDGYASILRIVSELMMRMEASEQKDYNTQGIVLIDEIEAHLHIDLQKKILPFLTSLFPRLQFIVTTHSPFVLSSLDNAVVFDLEKKIRVENLSGYAVDGIIESYFDTDKYSNLIKRQVSRYETLLQKASPTEDEQAEIYEIKQILQRVPLELAPELVEKFEELELNAILK